MHSSAYGRLLKTKSISLVGTLPSSTINVFTSATVSTQCTDNVCVGVLFLAVGPLVWCSVITIFCWGGGEGRGWGWGWRKEESSYLQSCYFQYQLHMGCIGCIHLPMDDYWKPKTYLWLEHQLLPRSMFLHQPQCQRNALTMFVLGFCFLLLALWSGVLSSLLFFLFCCDCWHWGIWIFFHSLVTFFPVHTDEFVAKSFWFDECLLPLANDSWKKGKSRTTSLKRLLLGLGVGWVCDVGWVVRVGLAGWGWGVGVEKRWNIIFTVLLFPISIAYGLHRMHSSAYGRLLKTKSISLVGTLPSSTINVFTSATVSTQCTDNVCVGVLFLAVGPLVWCSVITIFCWGGGEGRGWGWGWRKEESSYLQSCYFQYQLHMGCIGCIHLPMDDYWKPKTYLWLEHQLLPRSMFLHQPQCQRNALTMFVLGFCFLLLALWSGVLSSLLFFLFCCDCWHWGIWIFFHSLVTFFPVHTDEFVAKSFWFDECLLPLANDSWKKGKSRTTSLKRLLLGLGVGWVCDVGWVVRVGLAGWGWGVGVEKRWNIIFTVLLFPISIAYGLHRMHSSAYGRLLKTKSISLVGTLPSSTINVFTSATVSTQCTDNVCVGVLFLAVGPLVWCSVITIFCWGRGEGRGGGGEKRNHHIYSLVISNINCIWDA